MTPAVFTIITFSLLLYLDEQGKKRKRKTRGNYIYSFLDRVFYIKIIDLFTSYINIHKKRKSTEHKTTLPLLHCILSCTLFYFVSVNFAPYHHRGPDKRDCLLECAFLPTIFFFICELARSEKGLLISQRVEKSSFSSLSFTFTSMILSLRSPK